MRRYIVIGILVMIVLVSGVVVYTLNKQEISHTLENEIPGIEESKSEEIAEDEIIENPKENEILQETAEIPNIEVKTSKQEEKSKSKEETKKQTKPSNNQTSKQEEKSVPVSQSTTPTMQDKPKAEEKPVETSKTTTCTTSNNHGTDVGNSNKWYNTKAEAVADYTAKVKYWSEKWGNYEIDTPTYEKNCPSGYEVWTCFYCNKWTINYYYK